MKTQQRSFVVEYKSRRRQPTEQQRSIWGNTNFKALIKEAQIDAPQLFPNKPASELLGESPAIPTQIASNQSPEHREILNASEPASAMAAIQPGKCESEEHTVDVSATPLVKPVRHRTRTVVAATTVEKVADFFGEQADDLSLLEAENRRLKMLLAERFLQQNIQLKKMMERYDIV